MNLANPDDEKRAKAFETFVDEIERCQALNIGRFNFQYVTPRSLLLLFCLVGGCSCLHVVVRGRRRIRRAE